MDGWSVFLTHKWIQKNGYLRLTKSIFFIIGENTNTVAIIVVISMVSITAIGGYFFLKKRKENI